MAHGAETEIGMKPLKGWAGPAAALVALVGAFLALGAAAPDRLPASPLLAALDEELQRSMRGLAAQAVPPYFLAYGVTEREVVSISAANGALRDSSHDRYRLLDVDVRVGDWALDNTHRIQGDRFRSQVSSFAPPQAVALDDNRDAVRATAWLETDRRYKVAVEDLIQVRTNRAVSVREEDASADFSPEAPSRRVDPPARVELDTGRWERRLRELSAVFLPHPEVYQSAVFLQAEARTHYLVTSEGTSLQHGELSYRLGLYASTRAEDGMELYRYESFDARTPSRLPDDSLLRRTAATMVADLLALRTAPVIEPYTGPAILQGRAAGVFFHEIFGHRIEGHRQKDEEEGQTFTKKVGQPVLPAFLSVIDDPTQQRAGEVDLNGTYEFDDEGVPARRVQVVEAGILKSFLMSRSPIAGFDHSNGHGRKAPGYRAVGRQANLVVQASETVSEGKLRELVEARVRSDPWLVQNLRLLDLHHYKLQEMHVPVKGAPFHAGSKESLQRPDVVRWRKRLEERYLRPRSANVLLLIPCSAKKPYSTSQSHKKFRDALLNSGRSDQVHEVIVTSPLGLVPREIELFYPAQDYDIPVTGHWDRDEKKMAEEMVSWLVSSQKYDLVISHLGDERELVNSILKDFVDTSGGSPGSKESLRKLEETLVEHVPERQTADRYTDDMRSLCRFQFGPAGESLCEGAHIAGRWPYLKIVRGDSQLGMLTGDRGMISLTLDGAKALAQEDVYCVEIDDFKPKGNLFAVGVERASSEIRVGDDVAIVCKKDVRAVGVARMCAIEMNLAERGEAVHIRHAT